jgi:hypothetical protein
MSMISRREEESLRVTAERLTCSAPSPARSIARPTIQVSIRWIRPKRSAAGRNVDGSSTCGWSPAVTIRASSSRDTLSPDTMSTIGCSKASIRSSASASSIRSLHEIRSSRSPSRSRLWRASVAIVQISAGSPASSGSGKVTVR